MNKNAEHMASAPENLYVSRCPAVIQPRPDVIQPRPDEPSWKASRRHAATAAPSY